ncbi:MAG: ATP synthase F0 subunit B [Deltaproteobacteria bacterium]|nr:ATP synthase F0 subunit B [Deltaproteobacteria bacterium]
MKKVVLLLIMLGGVASAQPDPEVARETKEAAEVKPDPVDPTEHFNWFNVHYSGKDEYGGVFGDDVMKRADGSVVTEEKEEIDPATGKSHTVVEKAEEEPMSPPFIFMLINFGLFLIILAKYLAPAGAKAAQERHDLIKTALDEAAKLREQAQQKLTEYEARIKNVDDEVKKIVNDIRAAADEDKKRILENAERQSAQMKRDAELRIAAEIEMARAKLAREVAAAASQATEKLLREKVTSDDQKKLVGNFISGMGA